MPSIIPQLVFTSKIKQKIAVFIAGTIRPLSGSFCHLHRNYDYVRSAIRELIEQGVLTYTGEQPRALRFTPYGLEHLKAEMPMAYAYYRAITNNNHPGSSEAHKLLMRRQGDIQACMMEAQIQIGSERPLLSETLVGTNEKIPLSDAVYLPVKEMKIIKNAFAESEGRVVKETREQSSRASGILLSPGINAPVYDLIGSEYMKVYSAPELSMQLQVQKFRSDLFGVRVPCDYTTPMDCIALYNSETAVLTRLKDYHTAKVNQENKPAKVKQKKKTGHAMDRSALQKNTSIYRAMLDRSVWKMAFRLMPRDMYGVWCLALLAWFTEQEIYDAAVQIEEGKRAGVEVRNGDLYVQGKNAAEYLTCCIGRLEHARMMQRYLAKDEPIPVICWHHQAGFVREFLSDTPLEIIEIDINEATVRMLN